MCLTYDIAINRQAAMAPPPAFLFLHIQLSKSSQIDIVPRLELETKRDNRLCVRVSPAS